MGCFGVFLFARVARSRLEVALRRLRVCSWNKSQRANASNARYVAHRQVLFAGQVFLRQQHATALIFRDPDFVIINWRRLLPKILTLE